MAGKVIHDVSPDQCKKALKKSGGVIAYAAKLLKINQSTFKHILNRLNIDASSYYVSKKAASVDDSYQAEVSSLKKNLKFLQIRNNVLEKNLAQWDLLRTEVFKMQDKKLELPKWFNVSKNSASARSKIPILFTSDFQWGEVVSPAEVNGINAYNVDIAKARYRELIRAVIDISFNYQTNPDYPGIIYLRGGDTVSGDIHEELRLTNQLTSVMQVFDVVGEEVAGIKELKKKFKKVVVISVPGNHGRTTIKPLSKSYAVSNYDYLVSLFIEKFFEDDPDVTFHTPVSGDFYFSVYGTRFLLTHGDRIGSSGGQGFVGPAATISRGVKKLRDQYSSLGRPVDWVLTGHFHVALMLEHALINGSLPGYSEYAQRFRMDPQPPIQLFWFVDQKWGVEQVRRIALEETAKEASTAWFLPKN